MDEIKTNLILNIEIENPDLISKINIISTELSLSLNDFILEAINKLLTDINFVRALRELSQKY